MTILQLKYVIAIAGSTSMREAASKLFVSQPALSATIHELEEELGIKIFDRNNKGISLSVSMQHYVFAVHAFVNVIKEYKTDKYVYTVRETKTDGVLSDVKKLKSEIGIISYSKSNKNIMKKLFREYGLEFYPLMVRNTYAYVWKGHPLTEKKEISLDELKEYPCVSFDQSSDSEFYLSEEALGDYEFDKLIKSNDRATSAEIMAQLNGYSIGTGIMTDSITFKDEFVAIKLKEEDPLTIGYIIRKNHKISDIGKAYIEELQKYKEGA